MLVVGKSSHIEPNSHTHIRSIVEVLQNGSRRVSESSDSSSSKIRFTSKVSVVAIAFPASSLVATISLFSLSSKNARVEVTSGNKSSEVFETATKRKLYYYPMTVISTSSQLFSITIKPLSTKCIFIIALRLGSLEGVV